MAGQPWFQFFPGDWLRAADLRAVSPAARGLWIDLLCYMHQSDPRGFLLVNGVAPTRAQLARMTGCDDTELRQFLGELEASGVFSRDGNGVIFNRRMIKEAHISRVRAKAGKKAAKRQQTCQQNVSKSRANRAAKSQQNIDSDFDSVSVVKGGVGGNENGLPETLDVEPFREAWTLFLEHRKSIRKPLKALGQREQLKILCGWSAEFGIDAVIESIRKSVANQWQGIFEPKGMSNGKPGGSHQPAARQSAEQARESANVDAIARFAAKHSGMRPGGLFAGHAGFDGIEANSEPHRSSG